MRRFYPLFAISLLALAAPLQAQEGRPADLQPLPVVAPPPPEMAPIDAALEPQVTIKKRDQDTVEEYRLNGRLYMIKVTPKYGAPYILVDDKGDGRFSRTDPLDSGLRVPQWVIHTF